MDTPSPNYKEIVYIDGSKLLGQSAVRVGILYLRILRGTWIGFTFDVIHVLENQDTLKLAHIFSNQLSN